MDGSHLMNIPIAAFRLWEQQDFKELLNEVKKQICIFQVQPGGRKSARNRLFIDRNVQN